MKKLITAALITTGLLSTQVFAIQLERINGDCFLETTIDGVKKQEKI